jgi:nicotinamidase-related amidase
VGTGRWIVHGCRDARYTHHNPSLGSASAGGLETDADGLTLNGMTTKRVLILLDLQVDFLDPNGRLPIASDQIVPLLRAVGAAVDHAIAAGNPVINVGNEFRMTSPISNAFRRFAAMKGSHGSEWDPRAPRGSAGYFPKASGDAFSNPALGKCLSDLGASQIAICGVYASQCVLRTTRGAVARGLQVQVVADAIGDTSGSARAHAIGRLREAGAQII